MVSVKEPKPAHATEATVTTHGTVRLLTARRGGAGTRCGLRVSRPLRLKAASRLEGIGGMRNFKREF